jgi:hypothetical protein
MSAMCKDVGKKGMAQRLSHLTWEGWRKPKDNVSATSFQSFTVCNPQK